MEREASGTHADCEGGADVPLSASPLPSGSMGSLSPGPPYFAIVPPANNACRTGWGAAVLVCRGGSPESQDLEEEAGWEVVGRQEAGGGGGSRGVA